MAIAIAEHNPELIKNIFHTPNYTHEGIFGLNVFVKGRPEDVTVDDLFPIYNNKPAFTKPTSDGGWWLPLLEKAFAKVNINYEMISSGS
jgi:calpain-15